MKRDRVGEWMRQFAESPTSVAQLPDPHNLWWKAQALRRLDKQRQYAAALERTDLFQLVCATLAALAMSVWIIFAAPESHIASAVAVIFLTGAVLAGGALALAALIARPEKDMSGA